jgi:hypothetical protein
MRRAAESRRKFEAHKSIYPNTWGHRGTHTWCCHWVRWSDCPSLLGGEWDRRLPLHEAGQCGNVLSVGSHRMLTKVRERGFLSYRGSNACVNPHERENTAGIAIMLARKFRLANKHNVSDYTLWRKSSAYAMFLQMSPVSAIHYSHGNQTIVDSPRD